MKRRIYAVLVLCALTMGVFAENQWDYINRRHEIRIGWGDQLFESLMWHNPTSIVSTMPATWEKTYHENYRHNQHLWAEYQYRVNHWFSYGGMIDMSEVGWDDITRNGAGLETGRSNNHYFYNVVVMPTIRFTYFFHENVNLYSGLGFGMDINGGTETNVHGRRTDVGAALNITVFGVSANYDRWFWTVDFGGMYALKNTNTIFMASSRIINVGLGVRF
ncbi:MAG: hypothetical protein II140_03285 [Paludibacteraceae bacterium]|nr:hypothetical protein [Paludibacteraceae bacterium]MBQ2189277.1 hypothetical protein [Paludibacteraceae bacterium]MBQ2520956.1 hypothetical protein [Paludibacteraceae bacterium]